ncbi:MAG: dihydrofolate reductase [Eubacterium sp.]
MTISIIAAIGKNNELGKGNDLIWHFKEDMQFFKATTTGHTVIMGRRTFESLPKALPNRKNIVISSNANYNADGATVVTTPDEALSIADSDEVFIIGGGKVYAEFLPQADKLYLTEIMDECPAADTYFPTFNKAEYNRRVLAEHNNDGTIFHHVLYAK